MSVSVKQRVLFALAVLALHWVATFTAPRPLPNGVPQVPKDLVVLHLEEF